MKQSYTAVVKQDGDWWIGWIEEVPGVNCQERTRDELLESLRATLGEALEMNRADAKQAAGISKNNSVGAFIPAQSLIGKLVCHFVLQHFDNDVPRMLLDQTVGERNRARFRIPVSPIRGERLDPDHRFQKTEIVLVENIFVF